MSSEILSFLGWTFLPDLITTNLQKLYYKLTIRAGDPSPQPGSQKHARHRRRIYIGVIVVYLCYTLYEADWEIRRAGDFYTQLGVDHDVEEKALQSRFRRLTLLHHPDKLPQSTTAEARAQAEARYVSLQLARDTLASPAKRFAYDRFGPSMLEWQNCKNIRDFMYVGTRNLVPFYLISAVFMTILGWMGFGDFGYWRYLAIATLATIELHTITRPHFTFLTRIPTLPRLFLLSPSATASSAAAASPPFPISLLVRLINALTNNALTSLLTRNPYLPHQAIRVAHRAALAFFIALSRLGPLLVAPSDPAAAAAMQAEDGDKSETALRNALARMEKTITVSCTEASRLLALELVPFRAGEAEEGGGAQEQRQRLRQGGGGGERRPYLREKIKEWLVTNSIRSDAEVQEAVGRVIEQRKGGGGNGAAVGSGDGNDRVGR